MQKCVRGANWGIPKLSEESLLFLSPEENSIVINLPLKSVSQVQGQGREISLDFSAADNFEGVSNIKFHVVNDAHIRGEFEEKKRATTTATATDKPEDASDDDDEPLDSAAAMLNALKAKCEEDVSGLAIANFDNVLMLAPKSRLDFDLYKEYVRIRGKRNSWLVNYTNISQIFLLPSQDGATKFFVISLTKAIKSGQTPYFHLVLSFEEDKVMRESDPFLLNITESEVEELNSKSNGPKISQKMSGPVFEIVAKIFKVLSGAKIIGPSKFQGFTSKPGDQPHRSIACSYKAQAGAFFPLEKSFFFLPKPATYIRNDDIKVVKFRNVGQRFFDLAISTKGSANPHEIQSIDKNEYLILCEWFKAKQIRLEGTKEDIMKQQIEALGDDTSSDDEDFQKSLASSSSSEEGKADGSQEEGEKKKKKEKSEKKKNSKDSKKRKHSDNKNNS